MTLRLGNKKVCPTKLVKVNNVDWDKIGYVFERYDTYDTYYRIQHGKVYARGGVYPRAAKNETGTTKFVNFSQPFEINIEFTAPPVTSHNHVLFGNGYSNQYYRSPACEYQANTADVTFWAGLSTSGSTWDYGLVFTPDEIPRVAGDIYNVNYKYDGNRFILSVTHNNITLTKSVEVIGTPYYNTTYGSSGTYFSFGKNASNTITAFDGYFHAWNTYIKQNNVLVWGCEKGRNYIEVDPNNYLISNVTKVGAIEDSKGIISNFSNDNYGIIDLIPTNVTSFEFNLDFITPSDSATTYEQAVIGNSSDNRTTPQIEVEEGLFRMLCSTDGSSWDARITCSVAANTHYTAKLLWDGSTISGYIKDDGGNITNLTVETSNSLTSLYWVNKAAVGWDGSGTFWKGSINLNNCSLKINGQEVWKGVVSQGTRG